MGTSSGVEESLRRGQPELGSTCDVEVWDLPTRIFHWLVVAMVAVAWATSDEEGTAFLIHALAGYAVLVALLFRITWGFFGGAYARFSNFLRSPSATFSYIKQLAARKPTQYVGHNPLGGWMIIALLAVLGLVVVSGLFAEGSEGLAGPWAASAVGLSAQDWYEVHEFVFNVLLALVVLHIAGVIVDQLLTGDKLVRAMFTGKKRMRQQERTLEASTGVTRALGILAAALVVTGFLMGWKLPNTTATEAESEAEQEQQREEG